MNVLKKVNFTNILEFSLVLILVTLLLGYAFNSISIGIFFLAAFFYALKNRFIIEFNQISIFFICFYCICLISLFWTSNSTITSKGLISLIPYLLLPLGFLFISKININKKKIFDLFSKAIALGALYSLLLGVIKSLVNHDISYLFYHNLSNNLSNLSAIYFSVFVSFGICYYLIKTPKSRLDYFTILFLALFLILLSSKTIIAITIINSLILLFWKKTKIKFILKNILILIALLVVFIFASKNIVNRVKVEFDKTKFNEVLSKKEFGHVYPWTGASLRVFQIKAFCEITSQQKNILLGSGLKNSQESLNNKYKEYNVYPGFLNYNYHNQYIQTIAELGIVGLLLLLLIFSSLIKRGIIKKDSFLLSFLILIIVICITESFLWRQRGMVFFITISLLYTRKNSHKI